MQARAIFILAIVTTICARAAAQDKYTIHENLHVGQKIAYAFTDQYNVKSTAKDQGKSTGTDTQTGMNWKVTLTILDVADGSATHAQADVDADSVNTSKTGTDEVVKTPCSYAGKSVLIRRHADESMTNNYTGNASDDDKLMLNNFLVPDEDLYPDTPVAVGDVWDVSDKVSKHTVLGPADQLKSQCRLDWVKSINGKQIAQISCSTGTIYRQEGNVELDSTTSATLLVDIAAGMIIKYDEKGSSTYSTPPTQALQVTGGTESTFHAEVIPDANTTGAGATTKP